jgi:hypothetical protein
MRWRAAPRVIDEEQQLYAGMARLCFERVPCIAATRDFVYRPIELSP